MQLKAERHQIYKFIKEEIGEIRPEILGVLSEKIKEYSKLHNKKLLRVVNAQIEEITKLKTNRKILKIETPKPILAKPIIKDKYKPYFNSDFLNK